MTLSDTIRDLIARHTKSDPIPMTVLALQAGATTRQVQKVVQDLREAGEPIGSRCDPPFNGYYHCSPLEALEAAKRLEHRGKKILLSAGRMRKAALKSMRNQLPLQIFDGRESA